MPLFYFDVTDSGSNPQPPDVIGTEHVGLEAIPDEAADLLANIARSHLPDGSQRTFSVSIRDDRGKIIYNASLTYQAAWQ